MSAYWFGMVDTPPPGAIAAARAQAPDGTVAGLLAAWPTEAGRRPGAARIAASVIDPDGPAMAICLALAPDGVQVLFDDPAVIAATQDVLRNPPSAFVSTLTLDQSHIAGAVSGVEAERDARWPGWFDSQPFARLFPARRLLVTGLFRRVAPPVGPAHQRAGGDPWPQGAG